MKNHYTVFQLFDATVPAMCLIRAGQFSARPVFPFSLASARVFIYGTDLSIAPALDAGFGTASFDRLRTGTGACPYETNEAVIL